jgi:hypothetical protein
MLINFLLLIVKFTIFGAPFKFSGPWENAIFYVCREQKERGIGCAPDPFEFLLKNRIFVANIVDYYLAFGFHLTFVVGKCNNFLTEHTCFK